jgi:hypothetical protein
LGQNYQYLKPYFFFVTLQYRRKVIQLGSKPVAGAAAAADATAATGDTVVAATTPADR